MSDGCELHGLKSSLSAKANGIGRDVNQEIGEENYEAAESSEAAEILPCEFRQYT